MTFFEASSAIVLGQSAPAWLASRGLRARLVRADGSAEVTGEWPIEVAV